MSGNVAHSIHQRLLNKSRELGRPYAELLQHFGLERFLYRLSVSPYCDRFVLKGALLLHTWQDQASRFTRDIDLLGFTDNAPEAVAQIMQEVCAVEAPADALVFDANTVKAEPIESNGAYEGVRVSLLGCLGKANIKIQIDIGFGDVVVPAPIELTYPTLINVPPPVLLTYSRESAIAEKLTAILRFGPDNSRMKDYYDIRLLSRCGDFDGETLAEAIAEACRIRDIAIRVEPFGLSSSFSFVEGKAAQWRGFVRKTHAENAPVDLSEVVLAVREFLSPVLSALAAGEPFTQTWRAPGPWTSE